jgi:hypothetical protein
MIDKFKALEQVGGLHAVLALSRPGGKVVYHSPTLIPDSVQGLAEELRHTLSSLPAPISHLTINFMLGRMLLYVLRDHLLVLYVDPAFDVNELRARIKDAASRIKDQGVVTGRLAELGDTEVSAEQIQTLVENLNALGKQAIDELGIFVTANALKEVRASLKDQHPILASFSVGKNGVVTTLGFPEGSIAAASRAFAAWGRNFFERCHEIVPAFPPELALGLMEHHRRTLEEMGFHDAWHELAR